MSESAGEKMSTGEKDARISAELQASLFQVSNSLTAQIEKLSDLTHEVRLTTERQSARLEALHHRTEKMEILLEKLDESIRGSVHQPGITERVSGLEERMKVYDDQSETDRAGKWVVKAAIITSILAFVSAVFSAVLIYIKHG